MTSKKSQRRRIKNLVSECEKIKKTLRAMRAADMWRKIESGNVVTAAEEKSPCPVKLQE